MRRQKLAQQSFREAQKRAKTGSSVQNKRRSNRLSTLQPLFEEDNLSEELDEEEFPLEEEGEEEEGEEKKNQVKVGTKNESKGSFLTSIDESESKLREGGDVSMDESSDELTDIEESSSDEEGSGGGEGIDFVKLKKDTNQKEETKKEDVNKKKEMNTHRNRGNILSVSQLSIVESLQDVLTEQEFSIDLSNFSSSWESDEVKEERKRNKRLQDLTDSRSDLENEIKVSLRVLIITCSKFHDERIKNLNESIDRDGDGLFDIFNNPFYSKIADGDVRLIKNPTKNKFINALNEFKKECDDKCNVIIYIATQGGRINRGSTSKGNYLFMYDSVYGNKSDITQSALSSKEISDLLKGIPGLYKTLFLDVCHVKKPRSSLAAFKQNIINSKTLRVKNDLYESLLKESCWSSIIGACDLSQTNEEKSLYGKVYGLFASQIINAMKGEAFRKNFDFISIKEVWKYVESEMLLLSSQLTEKQTPQLYGEISKDAVACLNPSGPYQVEGKVTLKSKDQVYLVVTWEKLFYDGGASVDGYELQMRGIQRGDGSIWRTINTRIEENHYKVPHLLQGIKYKFRVCALNKYGKGIPSIESDTMSLVSLKEDSSLNTIMLSALEIKNGVSEYIKLMHDYRIYGNIQLNCIRSLVAFATRREIKSEFSMEVMKLTIQAMITFSWNMTLQLEGIHLLCHLLKQHENFLYKEFIKLKGDSCILEAEELFNKEETIILTLSWFKRELPHLLQEGNKK